MAQSLEKNKLEAKINRSRAVMQKVNVLYSRDGSDAPPIESLEEKDAFNVKLFFGKSGNENIDWEHIGVEGIIRLYYRIVKLLKGKVRNNIIKEGMNDSNNGDHGTTVRSGLTEAAKAFTKGEAYEAGFFIGYPGLDREVNNASGTERAELSQILNKGRNGEFQVPMTDGWPELAAKQNIDVTSSTFTHNRDTYTYFDSNSSPPRWRTKWPDDDQNSVTYLIEDIKRIIGQRSQLGQKSASGKLDVNGLISAGFIHDSVLGRRLADVYPEIYTTVSYFDTSPNTDSRITSFWWDEEEDPYAPSSGYTYGNGNYDKLDSFQTYSDTETTYDGGWRKTTYTEVGIPDGYGSWAFDYWDSRINYKLQQIKNLFDETRQFLEYAKVEDETYLINPNIPPGKDQAWAMQNKIRSEIDDAETVIDVFLSDISNYYSGGESTNPSGRDYLNNRLDTFLTELNQIKSTILNIADTIDNNTTNSDLMINKPIFGSVEEPGTLYGLRFLATRMIVDSTDGSKTAVESIGTAIAMMDKKLQKAEEELEMYGVPKDEWIYTPEVVGIEPYYRLNQATMEMEVAGWMVIWAGQDHCSAYDLAKSLDYDPATEEGTWEVIIPQGQEHTVIDRDANTGKVLMYYVDKEVGPDQKPYYKAKAYDDGTGEKDKPDYKRIATESLWGEPKNADDIEVPESKQEKPRRVYDPKEPVKVNRAASIPPNTLAWTTNWKGSEAEDIDRTVFKSEVPFDSIGSNLMVFVNERFKNPDKNGETNDYWLDDTYTIRFHEGVDSEDEISLHVFIRSFESKEQCVDIWYDTEDEKPTNLEVDTVAYIRETRKYHKWNGSVWEEIDDPCSGDIDQWKDSIGSFDKLPTVGNSDGDIRLVLDENVIYRWNGELDEWLMISGSTGTGYWRSPVDTVDELPYLDSNQNGEIRFVIETNTLYRWNENTEEWIALEMGGGGASAIWGQPVATFDDLPNPATQLNEVRLVIDEAKMYLWDANNSEWKPIYAEAMMNHDDLQDVPVEGEEMHDDRYYREDEMDNFLHDIRERVNYLEELKPRDAQELSGSFTITGTKFYGGFLSRGALNYNTLVPEQYFPYITNDTNFILSNDNVEQFKDADKGVLKLYINDVEVDTFDLASRFVEDERADGQSYCPAFGENEKIQITSVEPYNDYPTYQRGDFELHFVEDDFLNGENKIQLIHTLDVDEGEIENRNTEEFIFFFDSNKSYRGFQNVNVDLSELNSEKYLSGIQYVSIGDKISLGFTVERMFNNTYPFPRQVEINGEELSIDKFEINHESDGVVGSVLPQINTQYEYFRTYTLDKTGVYKVNPELKLTPYSVFGKDPTLNWSDSNLLINTVTQKSDNKNEYFEDEIYRLPDGEYSSLTSFTNQWDSTRELNNGELQVFDGALIYPQNLFTYYIPQQYIDYRGFTGEANYLRAFYDSIPHNNGMLFIDGFQYGDTNIKVELKLPSKTGWLDLTKMYNSATFSGEDGDGCLMKVENNSYFYFTTGSFSTAYSNYLIIMRITFIGNNVDKLKDEKIKQVTINW